jgi:predicted KAP-like P-loop ATPase
MLPMESEAAKPKDMLVTKENVKIIFGNIKVIRSYNMVLLDQIIDRLDNWSDEQLIGDIFASTVC